MVCAWQFPNDATVTLEIGKVTYKYSIDNLGKEIRSGTITGINRIRFSASGIVHDSYCLPGTVVNRLNLIIIETH